VQQTKFGKNVKGWICQTKPEDDRCREQPGSNQKRHNGQEHGRRVPQEKRERSS